IAARHSARGAAFGDYDNDGLVEALVNNQNEPPSLLHQVSKPANHWVLLRLVGTRSNRSALGARAALTANRRTQVEEVRSGGSFLAQDDLPLHFGLVAAARVERINIEWPSGPRQTLRDLTTDRIVVIEEPR